ncbi:beta-lactamase family protein [Porticoccaceae bacterium]|nr:beta-lactamase family protein [Porticoccaceae bacterium]
MLDNLQTYVEEIIKTHNIPAASIAVWKDGTLDKAAAGILNLDTGVEANTDSIFQIGSITKVFTTCLIMKLVEDGRVELDKPVKNYLRSFQVADRNATEAITVQQLLNHSNGIAGDYFPDDSHEEGPHIARYVDRCSQLPLVHPVGDGFSYSNAAFAIAGRLAEVMLGMTWFDAMEELIYQPLGMTHAICRPAEVIRFRAALGHLSGAENSEVLRTCSGKYLAMGQSPAGTTPTMRASDLITFGRAHLEGGLNSRRERWLSEANVVRMKSPTVDVPVTSDVVSSSVGLGWMLSNHAPSGLHFVGHAGGTNGQCAMLRIFPEQQGCFAFMLNRSKIEALNAITAELTHAVTGCDLVANSIPTTIEISKEKLSCYTGRFQSFAGNYTFTLSENGLNGTFDDVVGEKQLLVVDLKFLGDDRFDQINQMGVSVGVLRFMDLDENGRPSRLFAGGRLYEYVT